MKLVLSLLLIIAISSCSDKDETTAYPEKKLYSTSTSFRKSALSPVYTKSFTYLALGDSYTVGQGITKTKSFPYQLIYRLRGTTEGLVPRVIAKTGWTAGELVEGINAANVTTTFNMVTLLIGVNNHYRGYTKEGFRNRLVLLLNIATKFAKGNKKHVFVLSIPDWGVTPFGRTYNYQLQVSKDIDAFNEIVKDETYKLGIPYINITPISRLAANNSSLVV